MDIEDPVSSLKERAKKKLERDLGPLIQTTPPESNTEPAGTPVFADHTIGQAQQPSDDRKASAASSTTANSTASMFEEFQIVREEIDAQAEIATFRDRKTQPA